MIESAPFWGSIESSSAVVEARLSRRQIIQLFFSANEGDSHIAEYSALQMAQRQIPFERSDASARRRRTLPPRRHLRS